MKRYLTAVLLFLYAGAFSQGYEDATITGSFPKEAGKTISITGTNHLIKTVTANAEGNFKVTFRATSGYYSVRFGTSGYLVYVNPGANFSMTRKDSSMIFDGAKDKGAGQNNLVKQLTLLSRQYFGKIDGEIPTSMNMTGPAEFTASLNKYHDEAIKLLNSEKYDDFFVKSQTDYIEYRVKRLAYSYTRYYGIDPIKEREAMAVIASRTPGQPVSAELAARAMTAITAMRVKALPPDESNKLEMRIWENFDMNNEAIYNYCGMYNQLLDIRLNQLLTAQYATSPYLKANGNNKNLYDIIKTQIVNNTIKQSLLFRQILLILKADKDVDKYYNDYLGIADDPGFVTAVKKTYDNSKATGAGLGSPDFVYNDINGKQVTLSSLKGSYVYIDVWAQWCGPCIAEIPSLKEIEKKYANDNIKFVSISIDKQLDMNKWKGYVIYNDLPGIQVITDKGPDADFIKKYNINSIPRFILIDPDGKIVSSNADRPSNAKLKDLLDKLLSKS